MATYDLTSSIPTVDSLKSGDILNCPYSASMKTITLPIGIYKLECWGAQGGTRSASAYGGKGGYSVGTLSLPKETNIYMRVGGSGNTGQTSGGFNGGGKRKNYNGGGGASDIRIGQDSLYARVIVAGGGGSEGASNKRGEYGGGETGGNATDGYGTGGFGGTQTGVSDSSWQTSTQSTSFTDQSGAYAGFGFGGNGITSNSGYGGAGGGGWYGGCGTYPDSSNDDDKGGGGGSGYVYTSSTASNYPSGCLLNSSYYLTNAKTVAGNSEFLSPEGVSGTGHSDDGYIRITVLSILKNDIKTNDVLSFLCINDTQSVILPKGTYQLECWGAQGGSSNSSNIGGFGGYSIGTLTLEDESTTLYIQVGGQPDANTTSKATTDGGYNGGGKGQNRTYDYTTLGQGGGGASDIRIGQDSLYARVIVAGGGGGSASSNLEGKIKYGGGLTGGSNDTGYVGTQTAAGTGGSFGQGGAATTDKTNYNYGSGGGGGGWYGGGACQNASDSTNLRSANGGGSGYVYTSSTASNYPSGCLLTSKYYLTDAQTIAGNASFPTTTTGTETGHSGNGFVRITVLELPGNFSIPVKVGYKWYNSDKIYVKVNDTWEVCTKAYVKINGAWKELINNTIVNTYTLSKTGSYVGTVTVNGTTTTLQAQVEPGATVIVKSTPYNSNNYTMTFKHTGTSFTISSNSATTGNGAIRTVKFTMPKGNVSVSFTRTAIATGTYTITKGNNVSGVTVNGSTPLNALTADVGDTIVVTSSNFNPSSGNMSFSCSTNVTTTESISGSGSASRRVVTFTMPASNITVSFTKGSGSIM